MRTWLFQGTPNEFDVDGYLAAARGTISWYVGQHAKEIRPGDQVFIWRSIGSGKRELSGVVAEATVNSEVRVMPDEPAARRFWKDKSEAGKPTPRVWLDLVRLANKKQILKREWLEDDPVLTPVAARPSARGSASNRHLKRARFTKNCATLNKPLASVKEAGPALPSTRSHLGSSTSLRTRCQLYSAGGFFCVGDVNFAGRIDPDLAIPPAVAGYVFPLPRPARVGAVL